MTMQNQTKVLIIDDERALLEEVSTSLEKSHYDCVCCATSEEAMAAAERETFDLIISDINLGGASGLTLISRIRDMEIQEETPVIFLSGAQIPDIIRRSHAAGGSYYLRKPFDPDVLIELVDKALWMPHLVHDQARRQTVTA
jgi:two-component system response regulator FlrC